MPIAITHDLWHEVMDFYIREAWLLDDRKFRDWLEIFTDDIFYWMPERINVLRSELENENGKPGELAMFEEDKETLTQRVARLESGMAWAEDPPSRTRHNVTNLMLEPTESNNEIRARTGFVIYRTRLEYDQDWFVGSKDDILRRNDDGQLQVARRHLLLDQSVLAAKNLSIFF